MKIVHTLGGLLLAGCSSSSPTSPTAVALPDAGNAAAAFEDAGGGAAEPRVIRFQARVGAAAFSCNTAASGLGTGNSTLAPLDFRVYVHDVRLVREDGAEVPFALDQDGTWQHQDLALLDFENKSGTCANGTTDVNTTLRGTIAQGKYTGIHFRLGVPFSLNHGDVATAPSPLNLSGLFWNWAGGYKFARIDGRAGNNVFNIHLGSTDCVGDPEKGQAVSRCDRPNVGDVKLTGFNPLEGAVAADFKALVAGSNLGTDLGGAPGCMSGATDPECAALLTRFGIDPATGQGNAATQAFFRIDSDAP